MGGVEQGAWGTVWTRTGRRKMPQGKCGSAWSTPYREERVGWIPASFRGAWRPAVLRVLCEQEVCTRPRAFPAETQLERGPDGGRGRGGGGGQNSQGRGPRAPPGPALGPLRAQTAEATLTAQGSQAHCAPSRQLRGPGSTLSDVDRHPPTLCALGSLAVLPEVRSRFKPNWVKRARGRQTHWRASSGGQGN